MFHFKFFSTLTFLFFQSVHGEPIIGGEMLSSQDKEKFCFMVSLQEKVSSLEWNKYEHICGGSILNSRWILTAGHCVWERNLDNLRVVIGHQNLFEIEANDFYAVDRAMFHGFQSISLQNDIALLRLKISYKPSSNKSIYGRLPNYGMKHNRNHPCAIFGYGATRFGGDIQNRIMKADVKVISKKQCRNILGHVRTPQNSDFAICALGDKQDSCQGDSGGPLLCKVNEEIYIFGLVSFGIECGKPGIPSIFTVTIPFLKWIRDIINMNDDIV